MQLRDIKEDSGYVSPQSKSSKLSANHNPKAHMQHTSSTGDHKGGGNHTLPLQQKPPPCDEQSAEVTVEESYYIQRNVQFGRQCAQSDFNGMRQRQ